MQSKQRFTLIIAMGVLVCSLIIAGCGKKQEAGGMPQGGPPEVGIVVMEPQRVPLTTELPGRTAPRLIAEVRPQVGGIIKERLFTEGSDVKEGQVLYQIDPASYQAALAASRAALARAEANLTPAKLRAERYSDLVKINAVSKQDYDDASATLKQAEAEVEAAKAAVETARINLAYTRVTAPISGRIGRSAVTTGALVKASQDTALATIQQLDPIYVDLTQSSADMLRLKKAVASGELRKSGSDQAKVRLILEDGTAYPLEGTLKFSEVTVEQSTGSVTLRTLFPNPKQMLLPGMFVRAVIEEAVKEQAILAPQQGVSRDQAGKAVALVVGEGDKVEPRIIKADRTVGDKWLVTEGLKAGDRVIVEGLQRARPGSPVKPVIIGAASEPAAPPAAGKR